MKYKILLLSLLFFTTTYAQVQKKFFVNDVATIEYVTVNFCVNNKAQISEVSIVADKTTYDNKSNIEQLRAYLLSIEYYPDSKLKNNCYDSTFEFINSSYKKKSLNKEQCLACKEFKTGLFTYKHVLFEDVIIKRKRRVQKEINTDDKQIYKIEWLSDCTYVLTYKRMTEQRLKHLIGEKIQVEIIDIIDGDSYVFRSKANFKDIFDYGVINKIK